MKIRNISLPLVVKLSLTHKCNLLCKHCYVSINERHIEELSTKEMLDVIDQIGKLVIPQIYLYGGEPLLRRDFFILLERIKNYKFWVGINTNATLITKNIAKDLIERFNIKNYVVSLDGDKREHNIQRGKNFFDLTIRGIENLLRYKAKVTLVMTVTKINWHKIEDVIKIGRQLGVDSVAYSNLIYSGNIDSIDSISLSFKEKEIVNDMLRNIYNKYGDFIGGRYVKILKLFDGHKNNKNNKNKLNKIKIDPCGAGIVRVFVRSDGVVGPCNNLWNEVSAENIREKKFVDIWRNSAVFKNFRKPLYVNLKSLDEECKNCEHKFACFNSILRCSSYFYPGNDRNKKSYCWKV